MARIKRVFFALLLAVPAFLICSPRAIEAGPSVVAYFATYFAGGTNGQVWTQQTNGQPKWAAGGGGGPWTRTGTTIAPTVGTDTVTLGGGLAGKVTWKTGLNLGFTTGSIVGPTDDFVTVVGSPGNGVIVYGGLAANSSYMEYDDAGNGGGCRVYGGVDSVSGNGAYVRIWPKTGLAGNGLSDGYASLMGVFMPESDGVAVLGSTSHGFSNLYLTNSTGLAPVSTSTLGCGTGAAANATVSLGTPGLTTTITTSTSGPVALPATSTHNNTGAGGSVTFNLPLAPPTGTTQSFRVVAAQNLVIQAPNGVTIYMGSTASSAGGTWTSNTPGSTATYEYQGSSVWVATSWDGTWTHS